MRCHYIQVFSSVIVRLTAITVLDGRVNEDVSGLLPCPWNGKRMRVFIRVSILMLIYPREFNIIGRAIYNINKRENNIYTQMFSQSLLPHPDLFSAILDRKTQRKF